VAALGSGGKYASYSNFGACIAVSCPSSSSGGYSITTTDRMGEGYGYNGSGDSFPNSDYTSIFGGHLRRRRWLPGLWHWLSRCSRR